MRNVLKSRNFFPLRKLERDHDEKTFKYESLL